MKTLHIAVVDKIATYQQRDGEIVCGNNDYVIEFAFDSEWDGYTEKVARFIINDHYENVNFTGNTCPVPIITNTTIISVGVYAGNLSTTTPAFIKCKKSILCQNLTEGGNPVINGDSVFLRYSAYEDGTDFSETDEGQDYVGIFVGQSAPTTKEAYTWRKFGSGKNGTSVTIVDVSESPDDEGSNIVTFSDGTKMTVKNGSEGKPGKDGVSPVVEVFKSGKVASIQVTDANGTMTTNIKDGEDGVSPTVAISKEGKVTTITITDKDGTKTATINDGEGGGVSSWNDLTDKPFSKETSGVDIAVLPQTSVNFDTGAYLVHGFAENSFIEGNKYIVVWNGKEYEAYCYVEDGTYVIGNGTLADMTTKTDHPFCVVSFGGSACYVYKETDTDETVTIKINGVQETIYHQLDPRYIPDMYYEESGLVELLPETEGIFSEDMGGFLCMGAPLSLVEGNPYAVKYNGVDFECVATKIETSDLIAIALGDIGAVEGAPTGAFPFIIIVAEMFASIGAACGVMPLDGSESVTVAVMGIGAAIHEIDAKYIPKTEVFDFIDAGIENISPVNGFPEKVFTKSTYPKLSGIYDFMNRGHLRGACRLRLRFYDYYGHDAYFREMEGVFTVNVHSVNANFVTYITKNSTVVEICVRNDDQVVVSASYYTNNREVHPES